MSIERLHLKRQNLIAQRDQLHANLNATIGAVTVCDELIAEELAEMSRKKAEDEELARAAADDAAPAPVE